MLWENNGMPVMHRIQIQIAGQGHAPWVDDGGKGIAHGHSRTTHQTDTLYKSILWDSKQLGLSAR